MKPFAAFLLVLVCACGHAQVKQFEIKAGLGYGSRAYLNDGGVLFDIDLFNTRSNTGPVTLEGVYHAGRLRVGIVAIYDKNGHEEGTVDFNGNRRYYFKNNSTVTLLASGYYSVIQHAHSSFYMGGGIGPSFNSMSDVTAKNAGGNTVKLGYQLTGLGFEYHNIIGFFVEAGYGYKGILCGGLQFHISQR